MSPLMDILRDSTHRGEVRLSEEDRLRICIWLDGNAPFYGTYDPEQQQAHHPS